MMFDTGGCTWKKMWLKSVLTLALLLLPTSCQALTVHSVTWDFAVSSELEVIVGDIIRFTWSTYHDVWINPSLSCDDTTGAIKVAAGTYSGTADYTVQESDGAPGGRELFFACHVGNGIHCQNGVNRRVRVFPMPTRFPTQAPTRTPLPTTSPKPTPRPTPNPTVPATASPSTPSSTPTMAPSVTPSSGPSSIPSVGPSTTPSVRPSLSHAPSAAPITTPSPTGEVQSTVVGGLEMTLFGISEWSETDQAEWESVTAIYQQSYYLDPTVTGVAEFAATLKVTDSRRSRRRTLQEGDEDSITLTFNQQLSYRLANANFTPIDLVAFPFETPEQRDQYVTLFLNSVGGESALLNVTSVSAVDGGELVDTEPPTEAPMEPTTSPGTKDSKNAAVESGLSTGGVIGIVAAVLFVCLGCCLLCSMDRDNEDDYDEDENPYIPPSPEAFAANDRPVEHAYFKD